MLSRTTCAIAALICCPMPSLASTIIFGNIPAQFSAFTGPYVEAGFVVTVISGSFSGGKAPLVYYGSGPSVTMPIPEGTVVGELTSAPATSSQLEVRQASGQPFLFTGYLAAHEGFDNPNLTVNGTYEGASDYSYLANPSGHDFYVFVPNVNFSSVPVTSLLVTYSFPQGLPPNDPNYYGTFVTGFGVNPISATPEPSSFALLGTGLLGIAGLMRKRFA